MKMHMRWQKVEADDNLIEAMQSAFEKTMMRFDVDNPSVDVLIADDSTLHELNKTWRSIDRPTDVLSFAAFEGEALKRPKGGEYLGDIAISYQTAIRQAEALGHSLEREMSFLLVHGLLHLLGYDHMTPDDEREMFALQYEILGKRN